MIEIELYELPYEPALKAYWPSHICDYNRVEELWESPDDQYDAFALYLPMKEFFERMALSSTGAELVHSCLEDHDQFDSVLKVLESTNRIPQHHEPAMVSIYSNTELPAMIALLLKVNMVFVDLRDEEHVKKCTTTMIDFLTKCHFNGHTVAVCSTDH